MGLVAKSDQSTSNAVFASYVMQSHDLVFAVTAPYSRKAAQHAPQRSPAQPWFVQQQVYDFVNTHGLAVRAVGASACQSISQPASQ
jgi:hypothetical protein